MAKDTLVIDDKDSNAAALMLNDAEVWGQTTPEMEKLLDEVPVTLMAGHLYGERDRRNTQDGAWKATTMTWRQWLVADKFGLTNHPEAKTKEGAALVFAEALDGARKDSAIKTMFSIGLDIDSGAALDDVIEKLVELKLFAIVYTSFSHGKTVIELKHDDVIRKLKLSETPNRTQVQEYLRNHHKDRYDAAFIDGIKLIDPRKQTADGLRIVVETPALDKFRVIIPLAEPVELSDLAPTVSQWKTVWENAVCGVAVNMLGVNFDASSCDVNRLFFTPRHPVGNEDWYACVVQGKPLSFSEIEPYSKASYVKNRDDSDPFAAGTDRSGQEERTTFLSPSGKHLNKWHSKYKERFLITDVIESFCDDKITVSGNEKVGTVHFECPFEHEHSKTGGTGTMSMNPLENEHGVWTIFCRHDACNGRNKLEFLQEILAQGWFEESVLEDDQWLLPSNEDDGEVIEGPGADDPLLIAATFGDMNDAEIQAHLNRWAKNGADITMQAAITEVIVKNTKLGKREVNALWKKARKAKRRNKGGVLHTGAGFDQLVSETKNAINVANEDAPFLFNYLEQPAEIRVRPDGTVNVKALTYDGLSEVISRHVKYEKTAGDETVSAPPPPDVVKNIHHQHLDEYSLPLRRIAFAPFFDMNGNLVSEPGYHAESQTYLVLPHGFEVPRVSAKPTEKEMERVRQLFLEVFGDFPFDGLCRKEIEDGKSASYANTIGMVILPFVREMIDGATPGHLLNKPSPGTGAGLVFDVTAIVWTGKKATMMTIPKRKEEIGKTIIAKLRSGASYICFDNIPDNLDSDDLAMALAQGVIDARVLGKNDASAVDEIEVNATWLFDGNNVTLSDELLRRMNLIALDARMAQPETRGGWRHANLKRWVTENRPEIVWACLTMIQNWIAKGKKPLVSDMRKGSFDEWLECIGGVLGDAGIEGFHTNHDELREVASDAKEDGLETLASTLADYTPGHVFYIADVMHIINNGPDGMPIIIHGWDHVDGAYSNSQRVGRRFADFAKKPRLARRAKGAGFVQVEIGFDVDYDSNRKVNRYTLKMRAVGDSEWIKSPEDAAWDAICG